MTIFFLQRILLIFISAVILAGCASGPQIKRIYDVPKSADTPYENILVVALLESFDSRKRLEKAVVNRLAEHGVDAVASTSKMKTTTPMAKEIYLDMLNEFNSDAVMITQLMDSESKTFMTQSASPEATYNVRPTYYFNVWEVELTEYTEPESVGFDVSFLLMTELYSVQSKEKIWAIESSSKFAGLGGAAENYMVFIDEGNAMVDRMLKDGLIAR
jgi:hypothetical protein